MSGRKSGTLGYIRDRKGSVVEGLRVAPRLEIKSLCQRCCGHRIELWKLEAKCCSFAEFSPGTSVPKVRLVRWMLVFLVSLSCWSFILYLLHQKNDSHFPSHLVAQQVHGITGPFHEGRGREMGLTHGGEMKTLRKRQAPRPWSQGWLPVQRTV